MTKTLTMDRFAESLPRILIFTSPKAGSGRGREQIPILHDLLRQLGVETTLVHTVSELNRQVSSAGESCDQSQSGGLPIVIAAGGDGTIGLAAATVGKEVPIVPMPLGTENLLAKHFGHQANAESVLRTIRHGDNYHLDCGTANGQRFLIMATCGFDAEVVRGMHLTRHGHIQRLSYLRPIFRALRHYPFENMTVQIDENESLECRWAMVFNLPCYAGGLNIEPEAVGDDGQLDVILFQSGSILSGLKYLVGIWFGWHLNFSDVVRRRCHAVSIHSDRRVPCELDGDYAGRLPLQITVEPRQVHLLRPPCLPHPP